jgi:hypothetical protein
MLLDTVSAQQMRIDELETQLAAATHPEAAGV